MAYSFKEVLRLAPFALLPFLTGCPNPNSYGTPRTIPKGQMQHVVALEVINLSSSDNSGRSVSFTSPMPPSYQFRYGISDSVDFGARLSNLTMPGVDIKWNFVRGDVDLAVAPAVQGSYVSTPRTSVGLVYFHLPVLIGVNAGRDVTVFVSPGVSYLLAAGDNSTNRSGTVTASSVAARVGLGVQIRTSKIFAITPEVTGMRFFNDNAPLALIFGLGLNFGSQPKYDGGDPEPNPQDPQAPAQQPVQQQPQAPAQVAPNSPPPPPPVQ